MSNRKENARDCTRNQIDILKVVEMLKSKRLLNKRIKEKLVTRR